LTNSAPACHQKPNQTQDVVFVFARCGFVFRQYFREQWFEGGLKKGKGGLKKGKEGQGKLYTVV